MSKYSLSFAFDVCFFRAYTLGGVLVVKATSHRINLSRLYSNLGVVIVVDMAQIEDHVMFLSLGSLALYLVCVGLQGGGELV